MWFLLIFSCLFAAPLYGEKPYRSAELGGNIDAAFANNYFGSSDIFNFQNKVLLDFRQKPLENFALNADIGADFFFNINIGERLSFGLFAGVDAAMYAEVSKSLFSLLGQGNSQAHSFSGNALLGGSAYADAGVKVGARTGALRLTVKPAMYVPLFYLPNPSIAYSVDTAENTIDMKVGINMKVFTLVPLGDDLSINVGDVLERIGSDSKGFDLAVEGVYTVRQELDLGLALTHIPLFPARLHHYRLWDMSYTFAPESFFDLLQGDGNITDALIEEGGATSSAGRNVSFWVFRPFRIDLYAEYKPAGVNLFVLRPNIGFSLLTIYGYDKVCFNIGLEGQLHLGRLFGFSVSSGYTERVWEHALGMGVNLRVFELDVKAAMRGTSYASSFNGDGIGVSVGFRVGF